MPLHVTIADRAEAEETVLLSARLGAGAGFGAPRRAALTEGLADARLGMAEAGGHPFTAEQPEPFNRVLLEFLGG